MSFMIPKAPKTFASAEPVPQMKPQEDPTLQNSAAFAGRGIGTDTIISAAPSALSHRKATVAKPSLVGSA